MLGRVDMKKLIGILLIVLSFSVVTANAGNMTAEREGYCKVNKNRVMTYSFRGLPDYYDFKEFIKKNKPMHSDGRMTSAYYFPAGSAMPLAGFSSCSSLQAAIDFLYDSKKIDPWEFVYQVGYSGKELIISCIDTPMHELCKQ